jgi:hypothetical protein
MVINESPSRELGSHWVALFSPNGTTAYYFDSLADEENNFLKEYLKQFEKVYRNIKCLQKPLSIVCGHYCIYFLYRICKTDNFFEIIKTLYSSGNADIYVYLFVNLLINGI